jgi:hypothetical protein
MIVVLSGKKKILGIGVRKTAEQPNQPKAHHHHPRLLYGLAPSGRDDVDRALKTNLKPRNLDCKFRPCETHDR